VDAVGVGEHREVRRGDRDHDLPPRRVQPGLDGDGVEQRGGVDPLPAQRHRARLQPGQVQQLGHEAPEPLGLLQHRAEQLRVGLLDPVDQVLEPGLEGGDRRAQLVGHVGDQVAAHAVHRRQVPGHVVERPGQLPDLVGGGRGDLLAPVAVGHAPGGTRHLPQRRRHAGGEHLHERQGDGGGDDRPAPDRHAQAEPDVRDDRADADGDDDGDPQLELDRSHPVERPAHQGYERPPHGTCPRP